jgi:hypothetical protein
MKTLSFYKCRPPRAPGFLVLLIALAFSTMATYCVAQGTPPTAPPATQSPTTPQTPSTGPNPTPQPPIFPGAPRPGAPALPMLEYAADEVDILSDTTGEFVARGHISIHYAGTTVTADEVEGNFRRELVLSGHAKIETAGAVSYADAIHVFLQSRSYRLDNPRSILQPDFLQNRVLDPVFLSGGEFSGTSSGYTLAEQFLTTTCQEITHHYELHIASAELIPHKRLILRRVGVFLFGVKVITLPTLIIPLDQTTHRPRSDYLPEFGQNVNEGYYARFPYEFAIGTAAALFTRLDLTQKLGPGYRIEQEYLAGKQNDFFNTSGSGGATGGFTGNLGTNGTYVNAYGYGNLGPQLPRLGTGIGPQSGGLFAMQGYFGDGFDRNFNASFRHQQGIGSDNHLSFSTELRNDSFLVGQDQSSQNTQFDFSHVDPAHGVNSDVTLGLQTNDSPNFSTSQLTGSYRQSFDFDSSGSTRNSLSYQFNLSHFLSTSTFTTNGNTTETSQRTADIDSQFQFQHASRDYSFTLDANDNTPIGTQSSGTSFGTLERLPELQFSSDTINFQNGWLRHLPLHFDLGVGEYSEPSSDITTDRILMGLTLQDTPIMKGNTEMTTGGGFEQRLYGDGAAQYIVRDTTRLRQHLGGRSGFDITYQYEQPEGGTPFFFDTFTPAHNVTLEGGYLDDKHFQLTARVGYDLLGTSSQQPWQSLSTRLMWRPTPSVRFDSLSTYDPNTGRLFSLTNMLRLRARNNFAIDLVSSYDPQLHRFSELDTEFDIPIGRSWRIAGLFRYNGLSSEFESRNLQLTYDWDCMEASLTYTDNPLSFNNDREFYFTLRVKALPFFRSFGHGPAGEAIGTGIGAFN